MWSLAIKMKAKTCVSEGLSVFTGCHQFVMTHPLSCKESLLLILKEAIPEILFEDGELSQGKNADDLTVVD